MKCSLRIAKARLATSKLYRLKDAASAHADIAARRKFGPMILVP
jgi:hypothetical protein